MNIQGVSKELLNRIAGKQLFLIKQYSPEILMTAGVTGVVTSTVLACKATLKCEDVIKDAQDKIGQINYVWEQQELGNLQEAYTEYDKRKDLTIAYAQTLYDLGKLYGPSLVLGVASIGCLIGAHGVLKSRNIALAAAYKALDNGFKMYRKRVIEEHGEDVDYMYYNGLRPKTVTETVTNKDGTKKKVKKIQLDVDDPNNLSAYARFFDETCSQWSPTSEYNLMFLRAQQNWFNDMLKVRGHVFLNEVYDALGIPRTSAGSIVGWKLDSDGDNYIDFGIFDGDNTKKRDFVNGYEQSILLDFNVDGVIYDLI